MTFRATRGVLLVTFSAVCRVLFVACCGGGCFVLLDRADQGMLLVCFRGRLAYRRWFRRRIVQVHTKRSRLGGSGEGNVVDSKHRMSDSQVYSRGSPFLQTDKCRTLWKEWAEAETRCASWEYAGNIMIMWYCNKVYKLHTWTNFQATLSRTDYHAPVRPRPLSAFLLSILRDIQTVTPVNHKK